MTEPKRLAFLTRWASPGRRRARPTGARAEIPSANGHATAPALARLMAVLACDGRLDGVRLLTPGLAAEAARGAIAGPRPGAALRPGLGRRLHAQRGPGHLRPGPRRPSATPAGAAAAPSPIPERGVSGAYVMNRQSAELIADRARPPADRGRLRRALKPAGAGARRRQAPKTKTAAPAQMKANETHAAAASAARRSPRPIRKPRSG